MISIRRKRGSASNGNGNSANGRKKWPLWKKVVVWLIVVPVAVVVLYFLIKLIILFFRWVFKPKGTKQAATATEQSAPRPSAPAAASEKASLTGVA